MSWYSLVKWIWSRMIRLDLSILSSLDQYSGSMTELLDQLHIAPQDRYLVRDIVPGDAVQQTELPVRPFQGNLRLLVVGDVLVRPVDMGWETVIIPFYLYAHDDVPHLAIPTDDPVFHLVNAYLEVRLTSDRLGDEGLIVRMHEIVRVCIWLHEVSLFPPAEVP